MWYTVLDLKDAFFGTPLAPVNQPIFAFEWGNRQLPWTRLPQGFKNSPTLFNEAVQIDLQDYRNSHPKVTLLLYEDDLLVAAVSESKCHQTTLDLLSELGNRGYRANAKKAQILQDSSNLPRI